MERDDDSDDEEQNDDLPNPPAGETTDRPFDDDEVRDLIRGAELLRYTPGTGKHSGNVMAVFRTPDGEGVGVTMNDDSDTPEDLIGETVARERPFVRGSGTSHGKAFILFEDRDRGTEKIIVRNTAAIGLYEVEVEDEEPEVRADGGRRVGDLPGANEAIDAVANAQNLTRLFTDARAFMEDDVPPDELPNGRS